MSRNQNEMPSPIWPLCLLAGMRSRAIAAAAAPPVARRAHFVDVPHVRQKCSWDCGLACVVMVLRTLGVGEECEIGDLEKLCSTTSIWTVDLAYLLRKFSVNFSFFTVTLGANPNYSQETFYREQLEEDICRVDNLFREALGAGISIQCRSIGAYDIAVRLLSGNCIAVVLVDKSRLNCYCSWMNDLDVTECFSRDSEYMGHYIVICGYDADTNEFEIRDPASSRKHERVSLKCLDEARKSFGTDEDILLVSLNGNNGSKTSLELLLPHDCSLPCRHFF